MHYFTKERAWQSVQREGIRALATLHTLEMPPGDYGEPRWFSSHMPQGVIEALSEVVAARLNRRAGPSPHIYVPTQECGGENRKGNR